MTLLQTVSVAFSFEILTLFMNMILSTMSHEKLFLSLLISRPVAEKMCSDGTDIAGTARTRIAMIEILSISSHSFFHYSKWSKVAS